jgi:hypothetical protein
MKRKCSILLASFSLAVVIIIPVGTSDSVANSSTQILVQTMGHGYGGG